MGSIYEVTMNVTTDVMTTCVKHTTAKYLKSARNRGGGLVGIINIIQSESEKGVILCCAHLWNHLHNRKITTTKSPPLHNRDWKSWHRHRHRRLYSAAS